MSPEIANTDMHAAWNGTDGDHWAENDDVYNANIRRHKAHLLEAAAIGPADNVLDIGCGAGETTRNAARFATDGTALGVDLSRRQLARARDRAREEGITNVNFEEADAQVHPFPAQSRSVAMSSFGVMFFADPVAAFTNIAGALTPEGRLAMLAWRPVEENEWISEYRRALAAGRDLPTPPPSAPGVAGLADPDHVHTVLDSSGFTGVDIAPIDEPIEMGDDARAALDFILGTGMAQGLLQDVDDEMRQTAIDNLRATIAAHDTGRGIMFGSAAWLITARKG
jgi:SAM-dependent methyltransferase